MIRLNQSFSFTLCALAATVALSTAAHAAMLYSQAPLDSDLGIEAEYSTTAFFGFQNAESYTLGVPSTVTGFRWWGTEVSDTSHFAVRRFDDVVTGPDTFDTLAGTVTPTSTSLVDSAGNAIFQFDLALAAPISLSGSGYLSVFFNSEQESWFWLASAGGDDRSPFRGVDGEPWLFAPPDLSMAVIGELQGVPEPGTLTLLGIAALAGIAGRRRLAARRDL
jgi:hypothetical protein